MTSPARPARVSPFRPFRHRAFATVWAGSFVSNIGTWIETAVLSGTGTVCQLRAPRELRARIASVFMLGVGGGPRPPTRSPSQPCTTSPRAVSVCHRPPRVARPAP